MSWNEARKLAPIKIAEPTDPKLIARWLVPGAGDIVAVTADPRAGGRYSIEGLDPNGVGYAIRGAYAEVVPERRLVMTWDGGLARAARIAAEVNRRDEAGEPAVPAGAIREWGQAEAP